MLTAILASVALLCLSALVVVLYFHSDRVALGIGTAGAVGACTVGLMAAVTALLGGEEGSFRVAWSLPLGECHVALDALSSFFLVCVFLVSGLSAVYGYGYLHASMGRRKLAPAVFFFNILVAAMVILAVARDGILFLLAWEIMSLASFFLVTYENEREDVRRAGMTYLIASHLGVIFLWVLFAILGGNAGTYDFDTLLTATAPVGGSANLCFMLALVGFGTKAGFWPVHIWLPDAHAAAPSHVSALMSGVMIKMGIYGLLRVMTFLGHPPPWWGGLVIGVGAIAGIAGVVYALAQHDLKRLLAYHSVENIGIIALGIGLGFLGQSLGNATVVFLGYTGGLLHILNHGLFKGLLFMGAGSVLKGAGTRNIEILGGLYRRMPTTATTFLVGSIAICGLPPLNGFVSEWLIYLSAFSGAGQFPTVWGVATVSILPALALIGGLAAACFVKAFGIVFLGDPRAAGASQAHEAGMAMRAPMVVCALLCLLIGLWPSGVIQLVTPVTTLLGHVSVASAEIEGPLVGITRAAIVLLVLIALLAVFRRVLLSGRHVDHRATWGCAYAETSPRMQYTSTSFAEPLLAPFAPLIPSHLLQEGPSGYFPAKAHYEAHVGDMAGERFLIPVTRRVIRTLSLIRVIQQGRLQLYLVYIALTLLVLLVWQLMDVGR